LDTINEYQWISINEYQWISINEFIDGPSMNMVPFLWAPFFGPFLWPPLGRLCSCGRVLWVVGIPDRSWILDRRWGCGDGNPPTEYGFFIVFSWFFSKNWISKNWKSIDIHCWTPPMNNNGFPSMNINGFPSMNSFMVHQ
jgi:hypothetical protein